MMRADAREDGIEQFEGPESTGVAFLVGIFFSFRIVIVFLTVRILGADARTGAAVNLALGFLLLLLVCFQSLGSVSRPFSSMLRLSVIRWVLVFLLVSGCSLAWSATVSLPTSFAYWCGIVSDVAAVVLLFRAGSAAAVSSAMLRGFMIGACCIALIAWILPVDPADLRLGDEEFFNTNQIGNLCAVAILLAQYLSGRKQGRWGWAILFLAVTLLRSLSKASLGAFLASEAFLLFRDPSIPRKMKMRLTVAALTLILIFSGLYEAYYAIYTTTGNQAETLTGRTAIWAYVLNAALEQPWIGHGFDSMWKVVPPFGPDRFEARHAENELLQQFYAYGVMGVILWAGLYGSLFLQIRRLGRNPIKWIFLGILLYTVVRGLVEAEPFDLLLPLWAIVVLSLLVEDAHAVEVVPANAIGDMPDRELCPSAQTPSKA